jgi:hypothetical protein
MDGNPVNLVDPTGLNPFCDDEKNINYKGSTYKRCFGVGGGIATKKNLLVNTRSAPWRKYISNQAPATMVVPVRHPSNLEKEFGICTELLKMRRIFTNGAFSDWELNARNIMAEISGVIEAGKEYALRDAIGIAYNPYNRIEWNKYALPLQLSGKDPNIVLFHPNGDIKVSGESSYNFKAILLSGNQYGISSRKLTAYSGKDIDPSNLEDVYEISLIIAFGVARRYFVDTSFGATNYNHRPTGSTKYMSCPVDIGPAFFFRDPNSIGVENAFSSEELWKQHGWGNGKANLVPSGCQK